MPLVPENTNEAQCYTTGNGGIRSKTEYLYFLNAFKFTLKQNKQTSKNPLFWPNQTC